MALPRDVFAVDWDPLVYEDGIEAEIQDQQETVMLADLSLRIDRAASTADHIRVVLETDDDQWEFDFEANQAVFFTLVSGKDVQVLFSGDRLPIVDFLNEYPLYFYCTSFAKLHGDEYFPAGARTETFNLDLIQPIAWVAEGVNPLKEFWKGDEARNGKQSIHEYLERTLNIEDNKIVLYDHRSGEIADFFTIKVDARQVTVTLYHCKASGGDGAGNRVNDVYEVCGQVVKSFNLAMDEKLVLKHIRRRVSKGKVHSRSYMARWLNLRVFSGKAQVRRWGTNLPSYNPESPRWISEMNHCRCWRPQMSLFIVSEPKIFACWHLLSSIRVTSRKGPSQMAGQAPVSPSSSRALPSARCAKINANSVNVWFEHHYLFIVCALGRLLFWQRIRKYLRFAEQFRPNLRQHLDEFNAVEIKRSDFNVQVLCYQPNHCGILQHNSPSRVSKGFECFNAFAETHFIYERQVMRKLQTLPVNVEMSACNGSVLRNRNACIHGAVGVVVSAKFQLKPRSQFVGPMLMRKAQCALKGFAQWFYFKNTFSFMAGFFIFCAAVI